MNCSGCCAAEMPQQWIVCVELAMSHCGMTLTRAMCCRRFRRDIGVVENFTTGARTVATAVKIVVERPIYSDLTLRGAYVETPCLYVRNRGIGYAIRRPFVCHAGGQTDKKTRMVSRHGEPCCSMRVFIPNYPHHSPMWTICEGMAEGQE